MLEKIFHIDLITFIKSASYLGLLGITFAESGLLVGFFLPGDSLLFTAGFLASQNYIDIRMVVAVTFAGAVLGDTVGYWIGRKIGPKIFVKPDSIIFHHSHVEKARIFFERHGRKTIILARFMPIVRTFTPVLAGVGNMSYGVFATYNVIGGALWGIGLPSLAYFLGSVIPDLDRFLNLIIIGIILISFLPTFIHLLQDPTSRAQLQAAAGRLRAKIFKQKTDTT